MIPDRAPRGVDELKEAARHLGVPKKDLLVLDPKNDPFNVGTPATRQAAEWAYGLWNRFGYTSTAHLRRGHYKAVSFGDVLLPDGTPYTNTDKCWCYLVKACGHARDLGLISPLLFDDRRNPAPLVYMVAGREFPAEPWWGVRIGDRPLEEVSGGWLLPWISTNGLYCDDFQTGHVAVGGYSYAVEDDPYQIEFWCEKSTMNDILAPLCRDLHGNLQTGLGFLSEPRIFEMLARGRRLGKPVRIFYISDWDPAGSHMPAAVARNIEYYRDLLAPGVDFALVHIGMTRDWATRYNLPRSPIKDEDGRKANFEAIHGEGCVELDALEALHPGALARELRAALRPYLDLELPGRLHATRDEAEAEANEQWEQVTAEIRDELGTIRAEVRPIAASYRQQVADLGNALNAELEPYRARLDDLWQQLVDLADPNTDKPVVELPDRPPVLTPPVDESGWLYRSDRHWYEQLQRYKAEKVAARDEVE